MYSACLFCSSSLTTNDVIEAFPVGRRLAFDAARGRLWVVCPSCERWNLTPFETRWEAIEECERRFRAERKRVTTAQIGLAKLDEGLELVRIGTPLESEFAAWRYGDQFGRRRRQAITEGVAVAGAVGIALAGAILAGAATVAAVGAYHASNTLIRKRQSRNVIACIPTAEGDSVTVLGDKLGEARLKSDLTTDARWRLVLPHEQGSITLSDHWAVNALSMLMPTINGTGGSQQRVARALKRLQGVHHVDHFLQFAAATSSHSSRPGVFGAIARLPVDIRLAIEMAVNEENERYALEGDLWLLEFAWEQAEAIAQIADSMLVPANIERKLANLKGRLRKRRE